MTYGARVDVHTAYVAVMRERALDERPDGARQRARETTPVRTRCAIVLQRNACALGRSVTCSVRASKMMYATEDLSAKRKIAAAWSLI